MYESFPGREKGIAMPKSRLVTRENAKKKKMEERVSMRSTYGYMDPTPYEAVKNMIRRGESVADGLHRSGGVVMA